MEFQLTWSERASQNLQGIRDYIGKDRPRAAERLGKAIFKRVELLRMFPFMGAAYAGRVREIVYKNYRIFYEVNKQRRTVEILCIWHGRRQEPRL